MKWEITEKAMKPTSDLICPFCKSKLILRWSSLHAHADISSEIMRRADSGVDIEELKEIWEAMPSMFSYVDDQRWKCPDCHFAPMFGIPVKIDDYKEMVKRRKYSSQFIPVEEWLEDEVIKQRLIDLGYF